MPHSLPLPSTSEDTKIKADIVVIGGGSGGLSVAAGAVQMGASVVLLEGGAMGGDCLNFGCVPSKSLLAASKHAMALRLGGDWFQDTPRFDTPLPSDFYQQSHQHVHSVIAAIAPHDSQERFEQLGVRVIREYGRFVGRNVVQAGAHTITARRIVVATGSSPFVPPIKGIGETPYVTNETIFTWQKCPRHLIVIGGGPIGLEMAQAHARQGADVTVIEAVNILPRDDAELATYVKATLQKEGVRLREQTAVTAISGTEGAISVTVQAGNDPQAPSETINGSHILVAVGRRPNLDKLDLDAGGIAFTPHGIAVDAGLRSLSNRAVYAIGDAAGGMQFTHLAGYHAGIVIRSALFGVPAKARTDHIPRVTYTDPELAHVGLSEVEAKDRYGNALRVFRLPYAENDRALAEHKGYGLVKLMVHNNRPVGVSIVGINAGDLIGVWSLVIANRLKIGAVANSVMPYPTLVEINKQIAGLYYKPILFESAWIKRFVRLIQRF